MSRRSYRIPGFPRKRLPFSSGSGPRYRPTKRSHNVCKSCRHTWYPRGRDVSRRCPACGSGAVTTPFDELLESFCLIIQGVAAAIWIVAKAAFNLSKSLIERWRQRSSVMEVYMDSMPFSCPACSHVFDVHEDLFDKTASCPACKAVLAVPAPVTATLAPREQSQKLGSTEGLCPGCGVNLSSPESFRGHKPHCDSLTPTNGDYLIVTSVTASPPTMLFPPLAEDAPLDEPSIYMWCECGLLLRLPFAASGKFAHCRRCEAISRVPATDIAIVADDRS